MLFLFFTLTILFIGVVVNYYSDRNNKYWDEQRLQQLLNSGEIIRNSNGRICGFMASKNFDHTERRMIVNWLEEKMKENDGKNNNL